MTLPSIIAFDYDVLPGDLVGECRRAVSDYRAWQRRRNGYEAPLSNFHFFLADAVGDMGLISDKAWGLIRWQRDCERWPA